MYGLSTDVFTCQNKLTPVLKALTTGPQSQEEYVDEYGQLGALLHASVTKSKTSLTTSVIANRHAISTAQVGPHFFLFLSTNSVSITLHFTPVIKSLVNQTICSLVPRLYGIARWLSSLVVLIEPSPYHCSSIRLVPIHSSVKTSI